MLLQAKHILWDVTIATIFQSIFVDIYADNSVLCVVFYTFDLIYILQWTYYYKFLNLFELLIFWIFSIFKNEQIILNILVFSLWYSDSNKANKEKIKKLKHLI